MFQNGNILTQFRGPWGVRVEIDQSILFLGGFLLYMSLNGGLFDGMIFALILILSIYLHELGHAWGCIVQGVPVRRVVLHGGGGFCEHARSPDRKQQELIVLMGPLVNLALWALSGVLTYLAVLVLPVLVGFDGPMAFISYEILSWLYLFGWVNIMLFFFNILPVQPLDGGKLLHLGLLRLLPATTAHRATGAIGLLFSILWIPAAIYAYLTMGWILFFIPSPRAHYNMMRGNLAF